MAMNFGSDWTRPLDLQSSNSPSSNTNTNTNTNSNWAAIGAKPRSTNTAAATTSGPGPIGAAVVPESLQSFKYSREMLLSLFDPDLQAPPDLDSSLPIFVAETLDPVANLPLSETEKKILALGSVNSEVGSRRGTFNSRDDKNRGDGYRQRGEIVSSRGGRGGSIRRNSDRTLGRKYDGEGSPERRMSMDSDNQDDSQEETLEEKSVPPAHFPEKQSSALDVLSSASAFVSPSRQLSSNALGTDLNPISDIFGNLAIASEKDSFLKSGSSFVSPSAGGVGLNEPPGIPFRPIVPVISNWFYKDPMGNIQGPFSTDQMQDWFSKNFFSEDLPIKREQDILFEPLSNLLMRFGRERPFSSLDESEALFQQPEPLVQAPLRFPGVGGGFVNPVRSESLGGGYSPFSGALGGIVGAGGHLPMPTRFNSSPSTASMYNNDFMAGRADLRYGGLDHTVPSHGWNDNSGFGMLRGGPNSFGPDLGFGSFNQPQIPQQYNPVAQNAGFSQFGGASIPQFGTQLASSTLVDSFASPSTKEASPVLNAWQNNQSGQMLSPGVAQSVLNAVTAESPQPIAQSPEKIPSKALSPVVQTQVSEPVTSIKATASPSGSPIKSPQQMKTKVAEPEPKLKGKKSQTVKKAVVGMPVPADLIASPAPPAEPLVEAKPVTSPPAPAPAPAPTPAPWVADKATPKLSLKEIQELEQREFEEKEREKARRAHLKLMAEAQAIAEQSASGIPAGAAWTAGQAAKKSLADIMKEEETRRKAEESAVAASVGGGVKSYSNSITPVTTNAGASAPAYVKVAPVASAVPKATTSGWNVVGKPAARPVAAAVVAPTPVVAPKTVLAARPAVVTPVAQPVSTGPNGPSAAFIQWARQALSPLGRSTTAGVQVDDFIQILLMIPTNEPKTMVSICDDTLGGLTAIDPLKFADEFMRRRKADAVNDPSAYAPTSWRATTRAEDSIADL
ncbi:hypothetical protein BCR33DRAFT_720210 [Rhizoclosmatium globosum]|uniref:GYF domain-containing protein n=1 Tax=Rhizoclosmatium globosum TaxID=329046 RepID=A0A1Y2BXJ8_9FUNG|nr:hypothetical protein BCR33DRAFT_720210 [Rhizoclosmatium globosum]|eukprot:ORY39377.1 hypothetical protein BCR33DRAFT_720210 [Rhizoclosmatium globosum]